MTYAFVDFELDRERFELRKQGQAVRIEPRVFEVLVYLASNPERIISKQELIDHVWGGTIVSESALTRCIMEARKAIDDASREEPLIRTIHGRGYRFDAVPASVPSANDLARPLGLPAADREPLAPPSIIPMAPPVSPTAMAAARKSVRPLIGIALAIAAIAAASFLWIANTRRATAATSPGARIAILPVSIADDDTALQMIGVSLADLIEKRLGALPRVVVRGPDYSRELSMESASLADLAQHAGAEYVISGSLRRGAHPAKGQLQFTLHHVDAQGRVRDTPLGMYDLPLVGGSVQVKEYVAVRERIAEQIVTTLMPAVKLAPAGMLTPQDPEAYRLYLLARQRLSAGTCDGEGAIELLRRSLELDSRFAPAWEAYGWAEYGRSASCGAGPDGYRRALESAERSMKLLPGYASAIALKATVLTETGRTEEAWALVHQATRANPSSADLQSLSFYVLAYTGYLTEARGHLERLQAIDPNFLTQRGWTPNPYLYLGDTERFLRALPSTDTPLFRYYRGLALTIAGREKEAYEALEPAFRLNPGDSFARLSQALLAVLDGRPAEARQITAQFARERELLGSTDGEMTYKVAQLFALSGDQAAAVKHLRRAVDQGFFNVRYMQSDPLLESLRTEPAYRSIVTQAQTRHVAFGQRFGLTPQS